MYRAGLDLLAETGDSTQSTTFRTSKRHVLKLKRLPLELSQRSKNRVEVKENLNNISKSRSPGDPGSDEGYQSERYRLPGNAKVQRTLGVDGAQKEESRGNDYRISNDRSWIFDVDEGHNSRPMNTGREVRIQASMSVAQRRVRSFSR